MWKQFARAESGNVFVIVALASMAILGAAGVAVDTGRSQMVQAKLQNAVDAAGLAAGATANSADLEDVAEKYVKLNFSQGNLGATLKKVDASLSHNKQVLTVKAEARLPTTLMRIFNNDYVTLHAETEVTRTNQGMEVALVLDMSGSMAGNKINALKQASRDFVSILFGDKTTGDNLWIGIVPFSHAVNVGGGRANWVTPHPSSGMNWGTTSWAGCVTDRYLSGRDTGDIPPYDLDNPSSLAAPYEKFPIFYSRDNFARTNDPGNPVYPDNDWIRYTPAKNAPPNKTTALCGKLNGKDGKASCKCGPTYPCGTTWDNGTLTTITCKGNPASTHYMTCKKWVESGTSSYVINNSSGPNYGCPPKMTSLSNDKATIDAGIDALDVQGNTYINLGAVWGWRMLSPRWRGYWGGDMNTNNLPYDYNQPLMTKAAVIMTDGQNFAYPGFALQDGVPNNASLDTRLTTTCTEMKARGITVYTVVFDANSAALKTLMRNCATSSAHFFDSPSEAALRKSFRAIGDSLTNLRISK